MKIDKTAQQAAILWVVRTACVVFVLGSVGMFLLAKWGIPIPDQLDRVTNLAGVGALALLGRVGDSKQEAKDAVEKVVDEMAALDAGKPPTPVVLEQPANQPVPVIETPPPGPPPPDGGPPPPVVAPHGL